MCSSMKGEAAAAAQRLHLTCCWCCTLDTPSLVTGRGLPAAPSEPSTWWHKAQHVEAPSPPCGGTRPTARRHKAHRVVAQSPPRGGTKPTKWWHKTHQVVAQSPPRGGTKPTKWWYKAHQVVAPSCEARACSARGAASGATKSEAAGKKHGAWRGPWVRGPSSAKRRPPANRRGVRLPRKAYVVRSHFTYTYTPPASLPPLPLYLRCLHVRPACLPPLPLYLPCLFAPLPLYLPLPPYPPLPLYPPCLSIPPASLPPLPLYPVCGTNTARQRPVAFENGVANQGTWA